MNILDPISLPLNQSVLIEASAGTGKTYTMANLYLRLLLGVGCEPLTAEQILVVTFTKAATQELRDRIREKLGNVAKWFANPESVEAQQALRDPFLAQLYQQVKPDLAKALLRLRIAERDMDLASIFTIDSFCQKMLFQYAFDSGIRFDIDLQTDESELLKRLSEETWRELFYPADLATTLVVRETLKNPEHALDQVQSYLSGVLPELSPEQKAWLTEDNTQTVTDFVHFVNELKHYWKTYQADIIAPIVQNFAQELKILNGSSYKSASLDKWLLDINQWVNSESLELSKELKKQLGYFSQSTLIEKTNKGKSPLTSEYFEQIDRFILRYEEEFSTLSNQTNIQITYAFFERLRKKLTEYKNSHIEKNFTDMLTYFYQALHAEKGAELAAKIRQQFKFAMIDESQDTNQVQYRIFKTLFMVENSTQGFIMIGDPKQSIYKFRGADIFSYLDAAKEVAGKFTLAKNWRSLPDIVKGVNQLFSFPENSPSSPFLYSDITFSPVEYKNSPDYLLENKSAWNIYLQPNAYNRGHFNSDLIAEQCAAQIQQQLALAQQGELFICEEKSENGHEKTLISRTLLPQDIAILVRSHKDAARIKKALAARNIQSVYLSEENSVYHTQEAEDLIFMLAACLNPYHQKSVLSALGTSLWGLDANTLYQLKHNENEWEKYVDDFIHYQHIWQTQGILPMLHQLFIQKGIISRLNSVNNADRRITNLLHLAELLQAEMDKLENETALLRWFKQQVENPHNNSEHILRLESEENLIKIITIHKSKGLEYPVVWLPFIAKKSQGAKSEPLSLYRNEHNEITWDFNSQDETVKSLKNNAEYAEDLRLLYVALTRAKYQLHLILPSVFSSSWNAMHYLLANGEIKDKADCENYIRQKEIEASIITLPEEKPAIVPLLSSTEQTNLLSAKSFVGKIYATGQITSFSALQAQNERLQNFGEKRPLAITDEAQDYDRATGGAMPLDESAATDVRYRFPHSTKVGNLLHKFFELWDFSQPASGEKIAEICQQLNLDETWIPPVTQWFEEVVQTPFYGISLKQITSHKRLNEWQFYLRLSNIKALPQLNQLLKKQSKLAKSLPDLQLSQLDGFVRGFIDLIAQVNGKFYVLDYKSNFLGSFTEDYSDEKLEKTIGQFRYDLQYLLYTLAVHRYLRSRLGEDYDYERDFGGVAYLFLRGMDGEPNKGVYFDKPSLTLIEEMDQLFG